MTTIDRFDKQLSLVGSEVRAGVLLDIVRELDPPEARALLAYWFNVCDALAPWVDGLREQMERVGFFTDGEQRLDLPVTVYRAGWAGDDPSQGLSWSTKLETAQFFARYLTGPRAWFLGIRREDGSEPWIWRATCTRAYGYLTGRDEHEVIAADLTNIEPIAKLVTVKEES